MNRMHCKYQQYTDSPLKSIYKSLLEGLPPSPISTWDIASHIRCVVASPNPITNVTWQFTKEADPKTAERVYGELSRSEWWERSDGSIPEIKQKNTIYFPSASSSMDPISAILEDCVWNR
jgi:hypothetical protein